MKRLTLAACLSVAIASGASTATWEMNGYQDFLRGRMSGLALTRDGRLVLGPKLDTLFTSDQSEIWNIARGPDGSLYLGTGNRGRLFKLDSSGHGTLLWTADQPEIFAIAVDPKGVVYAGTSPEGKVYRIENGKATEYFAPEARYIWALSIASNGELFVATGDKGRIYRVTGEGKGEIYYETGQVHVTALAMDSQGRLLAGTEPNGILYRITARQKAFVLYDASLPEIRAIVPTPDGTIYAAALGGGIARQMNAASSAAASLTSSVLPTVSTTITVTDQQAGLIAPPKAEAPRVTAATTPPATTSFSSPGYSYGDDRSALYKIHPDNTVETLWSSKEENIYDLALDRGSILFLTDAQGRIYRLDQGLTQDRTTTLVAQAGEGDATRLLAAPGGTLAATGNLAKIIRLGSDPGASGWFESPVHDAGTVARWGRIGWTGVSGAKPGGLAFRTRTGNTARPDGTWSEWSDPISNPERAAITSPNARYIQWRAEFTGGSNASPALDHVSVAYLPQNTPPVVRSIHISSQAAVGALKTGASSTSTPASTAAFSITVTDTGDVSTPTGTPSQMVSRSAGSQMQIAWQADDPDGDRLLYNLYFRGEEETQWKLLRGDMTENTYTLEGDVLADGRYFFRVTASDRLSNPLDLAREAALVSAPVLIDNTPPVVTASIPRRRGTSFEADVDAEDRGSVLRRCEYSVDAGPWTPVEAADGVTDSARERFLLRLENFPPGEHLVVIRVYDAAGNAGLAKIVVH
ncbi:MAG: hypothetical protein JWO19_5534 [Bryobacterales bacterium]|nr:hypothetical protein [Bryobacterales bacterium]